MRHPTPEERHREHELTRAFTRKLERHEQCVRARERARERTQVAALLGPGDDWTTTEDGGW